ncbi:alpha-N-arabinofuranosidase [Robertkochia solimangrovi]|nr:alpha-N-arabinofuranosidase [Robertkochia solimangrovi]
MLTAFFTGCNEAPKTEQNSEVQEEAKFLEKENFNNPLVLQRADPFVTKAGDGMYYFIATAPEYDRIEIRKSSTINGISDATAKVIWNKHESGAMGSHIWAPELHKIDGVWYVYFAAAPAEDVWKIRIWVLSNASADPTTGEWKEEGQIETNRDEFALDATTFVHNKQRYLIWAEKGGNSNLYIAKMIDPTHIDTTQTLIAEPTLDWERIGHNVNEGPSVLIRNGKIFVTFSASATDANYAMGLLYADQDADLLDAASWTKLPEPVFATNDSLKRFGPGHNSFTVSEDGKRDIMIYHARDYKDIDGEPLHDPNRNTRARAIEWDENGFPVFGQDKDDNDM